MNARARSQLGLLLASCSSVWLAGQAGARQVSNGGFETGSLPTSVSQISNAAPWDNANLSSTDYFAVGGSGGAGVPGTRFGVRTPHGGNAFAGIHTYATDPNDPSYLFREYLESPLASTLTGGKTYLVSFWTSRADGGFQNESVLATNKLGAKLSIGGVFENTFGDLSVIPNYQYPAVISESAAWERVSFPYLAAGGEDHLTIGNFNDNAGTTVQVLGSSASGGARAYYYIDDVALDECSQVTNGDFESGTPPTGLALITNATGWQNANLATADYFAVGGLGDAGVPVNRFGSRTPRSGNAYAGIHTYAIDPGDPSYLFREYLETQLTVPLVAGASYLVEFWACRAANDTNAQSVLATDGLGIHLGPTAIAQGDTFDLSATPDYEHPLVITDSVNWTHVGFIYTSPVGGEQYLVLGNFNDNAGTTVQTLGSTANGARAYYYIDDVRVRCIGDVRAAAGPCAVVDTINKDVLTASPTIIGQDWTVTVAIGHPHGSGGGLSLKVKPSCCSGPVRPSPIGGRQMKLLTCGATLATLSGAHNGTTGIIGPYPVPLSLDLVGLSWAAQASVIGGGFADLSTAVVGMIGTH